MPTLHGPPSGRLQEKTRTAESIVYGDKAGARLSVVFVVGIFVVVFAPVFVMLLKVLWFLSQGGGFPQNILGWIGITLWFVGAAFAIAMFPTVWSFAKDHLQYREVRLDLITRTVIVTSTSLTGRKSSTLLHQDDIIEVTMSPGKWRTDRDWWIVTLRRNNGTEIELDSGSDEKVIPKLASDVAGAMDVPLRSKPIT